MRAVLQHIARIFGLVLIAGLAAGVLVHYSPGALVDERELNQHLSEDSLNALRLQKLRNGGMLANVAGYFRGLIHGDFGYSESNSAPIAQLLADRAPATLHELSVGLLGGWAIGLAVAVLVSRFRRLWLWDAASSLIAGLLLSLPAALLAYLFLGAEGFTASAAASVVLVLAMAPRLFRFARNLLVQAYSAPHVEMARARGVPERKILWSHVLPDARSQLLALLASSVSMGIGAVIPVEAICGVPGLGKLAWQAAIARDLPLLMNLTLLVALVTAVAMMFSESLTVHEQRA